MHKENNWGSKTKPCGTPSEIRSRGRSFSYSNSFCAMTGSRDILIFFKYVIIIHCSFRIKSYTVLNIETLPFYALKYIISSHINRALT